LPVFKQRGKRAGVIIAAASSAAFTQKAIIAVMPAVGYRVEAFSCLLYKYILLSFAPGRLYYPRASGGLFSFAIRFS
jgi:hypothetical protein